MLAYLGTRLYAVDTWVAFGTLRVEVRAGFATAILLVVTALGSVKRRTPTKPIR